ncbi:hypothetical protein OK074_6281 [Actinobacteria bacterium OK074]|nr:hypothetical protein OK074_6281 [Actinobacteria bacterium OK074]
MTAGEEPEATAEPEYTAEGERAEGVRPADAARRALREARARAGRETGEGGEQGRAAVARAAEDTAAGEPDGPAQVRRAVRAAAAEARARRGAGVGLGAGSEARQALERWVAGAVDDAAPTAAGEAAGRPAGATGPRPGDAAREALRAARAEAAREKAEPEAARGKKTGDPARDVSVHETPAVQRQAMRTAVDPEAVAEVDPEDLDGLPADGAGRFPAEDSDSLPVEAADRLPAEGADGLPTGRGDAVALSDLLGSLVKPPGSRRRGRTSVSESDDGSRGSAAEDDAVALPTRDRAAAYAAPGHRRLPAADHEDGIPADAGTQAQSGAPATRPSRSVPAMGMGAPGRDGELRRTFSAFPARGGRGEGFAGTWWGGAWVSALEEGALDPARLARGRTYADRGHVGAVTVTPGLALAYVQGSRPRPYRTQVRLRTLSDADWDRFLDAAAERPGHIAALLDGELPESLVDCGVPLLPGPGDLDPLCSCPDSGHPCKHAAALCYQTARLLDQDPFVLLLLRGRGERELLDALSRRNAARAARSAQEREPAPLPGILAREALAARLLPPLPAPGPLPPHPEQPPAYPGAPGGPDPFALDQLATDAAARAHALLATGVDPVAELTLWQDAIRLAAARPGSGLTAATRALYASLAAATGRTPADLARAVAAWRQGGLEALAVLEEPWDPPAGRFDRARPLLLAADLPPFRPWRNRLTHPRGHLQLRLGHDSALWYAYESEPGHDDWWPRGTPDVDPVGALTGMDTPGYG